MKKLSSLGLLALLVVGMLVFKHHASTPQTFAPDPGAVARTDANPLAIPPPMQAQAARDVDAFLPPEARQTLALIKRGGPFPHRQDGVVFQNREHRLPPEPNGWYHEYTVETPGASNRGTRRIITGGTPPSDYWYTDDHYETFRKLHVDGSEAAP